MSVRTSSRATMRRSVACSWLAAFSLPSSTSTNRAETSCNSRVVRTLPFQPVMTKHITY